MINKEDFYLKDLELLRQLEPILKKKGIEADSWLVAKHEGKSVLLEKKRPLPGETFDSYPTWRKDSLEAVLPEWVFREWKNYDMSDYLSDISETGYVTPITTINSFLFLMSIGKSRRGQESLKALAELIILLDKEGI